MSDEKQSTKSTEKPATKEPEQRIWRVKDPKTGQVQEFKVNILAGGQQRVK